MSKANEPAFPTQKQLMPQTPYYFTGGLTKREYFAGLALQGEIIATGAACANIKVMEAIVKVMDKQGFTGDGAEMRFAAKDAVQYADALIAELEKTSETK